MPQDRDAVGLQRPGPGSLDEPNAEATQERQDVGRDEALGIRKLVPGLRRQDDRFSRAKSLLSGSISHRRSRAVESTPMP